MKCCSLHQIACLISSSTLVLGAAWCQAPASVPIHPVDSAYIVLQKETAQSALELQSLRLNAAAEGNCIEWMAALTAQLAQTQALPEPSFFAQDFNGCDTGNAGAIFFYQLGVLQFYEQQWEAAESSLNRSFNLAARKIDKINALNALSGLHHHRGQMNEAWQLMREAYNVDSLDTDPLILANLALFALETRRYDEAIYWSRKSLETVQEEEGQMIARANLCLAYLGKKNIRQAQKTFETIDAGQLVSLMPIQSASLLLNYGIKTNAPGILDRWLPQLHKLMQLWPLEARSLFGWDWLILEWPSKPVDYWIQLAGSIPEDLGGTSLDLASNDWMANQSSFNNNGYSTEMGLQTLAWLLGLFTLGIWIRLGFLFGKKRLKQRPNQPENALNALMDYIRSGKESVSMNPVDLFEQWIETASNTNLGLEAVPHWQQLTEREQALLKLVYLGKRPKEAAQILNCSPEHIYNMRTRLRQKLQIQEDQNLREWISQFRILTALGLILLSSTAFSQRNGLRSPLFQELSKMDWPQDSVAMDSTVRFHMAGINPAQMNLPEIRIWTTACLLTGQMEGIQRITHRVETMAHVDSTWVADILREVRWSFDPWYSKWAEVLRMQSIQWDGNPKAPLALTPQAILKAEAPRIHRNNKLHSEELENFWADTHALHEWASRDKRRILLRWGGISIAMATLFLLSLIFWRHFAPHEQQDSPAEKDPILKGEKDQIIPLLKKIQGGHADSSDRAELILALSACAQRRGTTLPDVGPDPLNLTPMEQRFAAYLLNDNSTSEIADKLSCSKSRVYNIRSSVRTKLKIPRRVPIERALLEKWPLAKWIRSEVGASTEG